MVMKIKNSEGMTSEERAGVALKCISFSLSHLGSVGIDQETIFKIYMSAKEIEGDLLSLMALCSSNENPNIEELFKEISDQIHSLVNNFIEQARKFKDMK